MNKLKLADVAKYIKANIVPEFHDKKLAKLKKLTLEDILSRKNPYLFKAKHANSAHEFVKSVLDATASSGEETVFGNFLETVAIQVAAQVYGGRKSGIKALDLEFEDDGTKYLVSIKSGPNWGNSTQIEALIKKFNDAKKSLATSGGITGKHVVCVEACCYGVDDTPDKGTHLKLCGQRFWEFVSGGNKSLFRDIIEPLGFQAKEKTEELEMLYTAKLNLFTKAFLDNFCDASGNIDWDKLVIHNSGTRKP